MLSNEIKPGPRSPERRADKLNFFREITDEQMKTYSPSQIATILEQRENVSRCSEALQNSELTRLVVEGYRPAAPSFLQSAAPILPIRKQSRRPVEAPPWIGVHVRDEALGARSCPRMPGHVLSQLPPLL